MSKFAFTIGFNVAGIQLYTIAHIFLYWLVTCPILSTILGGCVGLSGMMFICAFYGEWMKWEMLERSIQDLILSTVIAVIVILCHFN